MLRNPPGDATRSLATAARLEFFVTGAVWARVRRVRVDTVNFLGSRLVSWIAAQPHLDDHFLRAGRAMFALHSSFAAHPNRRGGVATMLSALIALSSRIWSRAASLDALEVGPAARRAFLSLLCLLAAAALTPQHVIQAAPPDPDEGKATFEQKCVACHTVGKLGPDLGGVTERRDQDWLTRWISAPDEMLAEQDPIATDLLKQYNNLAMPNLRLSDDEVASVIAYLRTQGGAPAQAGQASAEGVPGGDPGIGKRLFTGTTRLENGGPPCIACHSITGIGAFGGGALGPDLTGAFDKLGDALITWPQSVPPMSAIFTEKPLTPDEEGHLLTFIQSASVPERGAQAVWQLVGLSLAGVVVVVVLVQLVWRRRLGKVREPIVAGEATRGS